MIQQAIEKIYIRPIKQTYFLHDLGPKNSTFDPQAYIKRRRNYRNLSGKGLFLRGNPNSYSPSSITSKNTQLKIIKRQDHVISTPNSQHLHLSFYKTQQTYQTKQFKLSQYDDETTNNLKKNKATKKNDIITLIYLHTHNGSRLEGLGLIQPILSLGVNFCTLDFSGYGNSSGGQVSLGIREIYDLQRVMQFLQEHYEQMGFILWGRSMGAVTALRYLGTQLHLQDNFNILGAIYDSPFSSIQKLTYEMSSKSLNLPQSLLIPIVMFIKSTLSQKLPFDKLQLQSLMKTITIPGIFISSKNDTFISYQHTEKLFNQYKSKQKDIIFVEKNHNQARQFADLVKVYDFIQQLVKLNPDKQSIIANNVMKYQGLKKDHRQLRKYKSLNQSPKIMMAKRFSACSVISESMFD